MVERLNGRKILLRGNHDFKIGVNTWKEIGFVKVYKKEIILDNLLLTHAPTEEVGENQINVFGHIHDKPLDRKFDKKNHICVSCDVAHYTPVSISKIKSIVKNLWVNKKCIMDYIVHYTSNL